MVRAAVLFTLLGLCWFHAGAAEACSYAVPQNPGETRAHAYERLRRVNQDRYWAEADTIFVGRVVGLREVDGPLEVRVEPRASFKGDVGKDVITYGLDGIELQCGRAAFPDYGDVGIFYASHQNERLVVLGMLGVDDIHDDALKARLIDQLNESELSSLPIETPLQGRAPLILGGLAALGAFVAGLALGRLLRKRGERPAV